MKSNWLTKLTDRSFLMTLGTAVSAITGAVAAWRTEGMSVDQKIKVTIYAFGAAAGVVAMFTHAEKAKDAAAITAALTPEPPSAADIGQAVAERTGPTPTAIEIGQAVAAMTGPTPSAVEIGAAVAASLPSRAPGVKTRASDVTASGLETDA